MIYWLFRNLRYHFVFTTSDSLFPNTNEECDDGEYSNKTNNITCVANLRSEWECYKLIKPLSFSPTSSI